MLPIEDEMWDVTVANADVIIDDVRRLVSELLPDAGEDVLFGTWAVGTTYIVVSEDSKCSVCVTFDELEKWLKVLALRDNDASRTDELGMEYGTVIDDDMYMDRLEDLAEVTLIENFVLEVLKWPDDENDSTADFWTADVVRFEVALKDKTTDEDEVDVVKTALEVCLSVNVTWDAVDLPSWEWKDKLAEELLVGDEVWMNSFEPVVAGNSLTAVMAEEESISVARTEFSDARALLLYSRDDVDNNVFVLATTAELDNETYELVTLITVLVDDEVACFVALSSWCKTEVQLERIEDLASITGDDIVELGDKGADGNCVTNEETSSVWLWGETVKGVCFNVTVKEKLLNDERDLVLALAYKGFELTDGRGTVAESWGVVVALDAWYGNDAGDEATYFTVPETVNKSRVNDSVGECDSSLVKDCKVEYTPVFTWRVSLNFSFTCDENDRWLLRSLSVAVMVWLWEEVVEE